MSGVHTRRFGACLVLLASPCLWAQGQPPQALAALTLSTALDRAAARNPGLIAGGYQIEAAAGRLQQAGLRPNPELNVTVEDALGTDQYRGLRSSEVTLSLSWIIERGLREYVIAAARAGTTLAQSDIEILRIDVAAETARRFLVCLAFQERLTQARDAVERAGQAVATIGERVEAGRAFAAELARAEAELARAELAEEDYTHELLAAEHRLAAQWGERRPDFAAVSGDVLARPDPAPFEVLLARIDANPELARYMSQQRIDESQLRLAEARSRPAWQAYGGLRRFQVSDDIALVGGISIPLPLRDRNQGGIAEARAMGAWTRAAADAERLRIETELFSLYQELNHNLQLATRLELEVIPLTQAALSETRAAYELGRYGYFEWRVVEMELLQATRELLEASVEAHRLIIEIERLTGTPFSFAAAQ